MTIFAYPDTKRLVQVLRLTPFGLPLDAAAALASHIASTVDVKMGGTQAVPFFKAWKTANLTAWNHLVAGNIAAFETDVSVSANTYSVAGQKHRAGLEGEAVPTRPAWAAAVA